MFRIVAFSFLVLACFVWAPCFAVTAPCHVTNFTPEGNYYFLYLNYLYNETYKNTAVASKFKTGSATSYPLYSVSVQLLGYYPDDYLASIEIYADNGGLPGASVGEFSSSPGSNYETNGTIVVLTLSSDTPINLDSDTDYWLAVKGGGLSSNSWLGTNINYTDPTDGSIFYTESVSYLADNGTWDYEQNYEGLFKLGYCKPSASPSRSPSKKVPSKSPSPKKGTVTPSPSHKKASASPSHKVSPKKSGKQTESPSPSEVVHHSASPSHKVSVKKTKKPSESKSPSKKKAKSPSKKKKKKKKKPSKKHKKKKKKG